MTGKKILISPLNWGLGHATRCVPVIHELLKQGAEVMLAGNGSSIKLLENEFPELKVLYFPDFEIKYGSQFGLTLMKQIPEFIVAVRNERKIVKQWVEEYNIDVIISDNRYGVRNKHTQNILITHQLYPKYPKGTQWTKLPANRQLNKWIKKFDAIWVPDFKDTPTLTGTLSHSANETRNVHFIGPLSRFRVSEKNTQHGKRVAVLSGPEPLRSVFEKKVVDELNNTSQPAIVVRGLPNETTIPFLGKNIAVYNHLNAIDLQGIMAGASFIIARAGYSTIMDLWALNKPAVLVPTPGQAEQEYLAKHLEDIKGWTFLDQNRITLGLDVHSPKSLPQNLNQKHTRPHALLSEIKKLF